MYDLRLPRSSIGWMH